MCHEAGGQTGAPLSQLMWPQGAETTAGATHYAETRRDSDRDPWKVSGKKEVSDRDGPTKIKLQGVND